MPSLTVYLNGETPAVYELDTPVVNVGRDADSDIRIVESHISSHHARFKLEPNGEYRLSDLESSNGTSLNGEPVRNAVLKDGDRIIFGVYVRAVYESKISAQSSPADALPVPATAGRAAVPPSSTTPKVVPENPASLIDLDLEGVKRERNLLESKLIGMRREQQDLSSKLRENRTRLAQLSQEIATTEQLNLQSEEEYQRLHEQIENAQEELRNAEELQRVQNNNIEENKVRVQELINEKKEAERQWEEYQEKAAAKLVEIQSKTKAAVNQGNEKIADIEEVFDQRKEELANIVRIIDTKKAEEKNSFKLKAEADAKLKSDLAAAKDEIGTLKSALKNADKRLLDMAGGHDAPKLDAESPADAKAVSDLHRDINARRASLEYLNEQWDKTKQELDGRQKSLQSQLEELTKTLEARKAELTALDQDQSTDVESSSSSIPEPMKRLRIDVAPTASDDALQEKLKVLEDAIGEKQKHLEEVSAGLESKTAELREADSKLANTNSRIHKATDHLKRSQNAAGQYVQPPAPLAPASGHRLLPRAAVNPFASATPPITPIATEDTQALALTVFAPDAGSPSQSFPEGAGAPDLYLHPPVGLHALAACTNGFIKNSFDDELLLNSTSPVLLVLPADLDSCTTEIAKVLNLNHGRPRIACLPPGIFDRLGPALQQDTRFQSFTTQLGQFEGVISIDADTARLVDSLTSVNRHLHLPLPAPIDATEWEFSVTIEKRSPGLFLAADGFDADSPRHLALVNLVNRLATEYKIPITLYRHDPENPLPELDIPAELLSQPEPKQNYLQYLSLAANHRFIAGFGPNLAGGEARGDALLCRNLFVGCRENDAEKIFADTVAPADQLKEIAAEINNLANDSQRYLDHVEKSQWLALEKLSFQAARDRLEDFIYSFAPPSIAV
ncbi:MAG: FHA domain-containing protein [Verrucomicrobiota bacterium]